MTRRPTLALLALLLTAGPVSLHAQEEEPAAGDPLAAAVKALERGELEAAEAGFLEALRLDPTRDQAWLGLSAFQAARGQILEALQSARNADELVPDQPVTLLTIGRLQATLGAYGEAYETLERARVLHPENLDVWLLTALLLRDMGRPAEAIERLQEALASGLDRAEVTEQLGLLLLAQDRSAEALEVARQALETHPDRPRLHLVVGLALARDADSRNEAIGHLERALAGESGSPERIRLELSTLLAEAGRVDEALVHLAEAEKTDADNPELHYRKGRVLQMAGDEEGARAALGRFQELQATARENEAATKRLGTAFNEAQRLASENQLDEALAKVDSILAERPRHPRTLILRAKILYSQRRVEEALTSVQTAVQLDPGRFEPAYLEGLFLLTLGRPSEAEGALVRAVALDADQAEAFQLLGQATAQQEKYQLAAAYYERALDLGLDSIALRLNYATVLESLGRVEEYQRQMDAYRRLKNQG